MGSPNFVKLVGARGSCFICPMVNPALNQEVNQGAPTSTDATLLRASTDIQNKPQDTTTANNQRSNYDHARTPNRGRGRRFFGRGPRNNYPVRNQDGSDIDRETINFLAADQTIQATFKPFLHWKAP